MGAASTVTGDGAVEHAEQREVAARSAPAAAAPAVNPEASGLVGGYRKAVPVTVRRAIAARVTPTTRRRIKSGLAELDSARRTLATARSRRAVRRRPDLLNAPGRTEVRADRGLKIAEIDPDANPLAARRANLAAVSAALDAAGVPYFTVPARWDRSSAVAVDAADRMRALRALAAACANAPGYAAALPEGRRAPRATLPGFEAATWQRLVPAPVVRMAWYRTDATKQLVLDARYGCDVEFWERDGDALVAPRPNPVADRIPAEGPRVAAEESRFTALAPAWTDTGHRVPTRAEFTAVQPETVTFPVDAVYTWVDGQDPAWLRRRAEAAGEAYHAEAANEARFISRDELRYSLRALHQNAPWIRHVYLVTDAQVPSWLDTAAPGLTVVDHRDLFADPSVLPTFNSHAIESQLHRIEGLSERFLYFNDDVFLGSEVVPGTFFHANGITKYFPSPALIPPGPPDSGDVPVSVAGKNNRDLLQERFGTVLTHKMKHVPHALRRSVLAEIEQEFPERHRRTAANRFRSLDDLSIASSLHHFYAYQTGRAVPGSVRYAYMDLSGPQTPDRLARLLASRDRQVFCLNDTVSAETDLDAQLALLKPFLEAYFPVPSPFEKTDGDPAAGPKAPGGRR